MSDFIRTFCPGGTFFFTVVTYQRRCVFSDASCRRLLKQAFIDVMRRRPFELKTICLLPDHLHFIMTLPEGDSDFSQRISTVKGQFTRDFLKMSEGKGWGSGYRGKGERTVWQQRYWEHFVRDEDDLRRCVEYTHYNPVKHGLVGRVIDWPWSSFHRYVRQGVYSADWTGGFSPENRMSFSIGE